MPKTAKASYLKAIWVLQSTGGPATTGALAKMLSVSPASASEMIKKLDAVGLVRRRPYRPVELTERGSLIASAMVRKHRLIELFLHRVLGMGWEEVHAEAAQWERAVSDFALERMDLLLGRPKADVHGHPIPLADGTIHVPQDVALLEAPTGQAVIISQVSDADSDLLRRIRSLGLLPGTELTVLKHDAETIVCEVRGTTRSVDQLVAAAVRVSLADAKQVKGIDSCTEPQQSLTAAS